MKVYYHASHEQFPPSELLKLAAMAERAGFDGIFSSDHFHPWNPRQGQSGYSWSWLGAALQATAVPVGMVCAPGQRQHPAIVAQAAATLAQMFPGRFWMAVGSGQALNERVTGRGWPEKAVRQARLVECVEIMRALWAGETVTHRGLVLVEGAHLYSRPEKPPALFGAALTESTARSMGAWADGLLTVAGTPDSLHRTIEAFREGGGEGKPVAVKVDLSWAADEREALDAAWDQWRTNALDARLQSELPTPEHFDAAARHVRPEDMHASVRISSSIEKHLRLLERDRDMGVDIAILHHVGRDQRSCIKTFGAELLPQFRPRANGGGERVRRRGRGADPGVLDGSERVLAGG